MAQVSCTQRRTTAEVARNTCLTCTNHGDHFVGQHTTVECTSHFAPPLAATSVPPFAASTPTCHGFDPDNG